MTITERYALVIKYFQDHLPIAETELTYGNAYELLISVILSAQCTDKRVNLVTPELFRRYPTPKELAESNFDELFPYIQSISYPNNKTKHLLGTATLLLEKFKGEVPMTVEELITLPGVGRKTANVVTSVIDQQPNMAVDTHVFRVSARLGLTKRATTPLAAEKQLIKHLPTALVHKAHHWLILHGRYTCLARKPKCEECGLSHLCLFYARQQKAKAKAQ
jgi:endonuclease III